jgi:aspartyl/asparaginyl beta-hydroxylase (cupin superfamily)
MNINNLNSGDNKRETEYIHPIEKFPQFKLLENNYQVILDELKGVIEQTKKEKLFEPWIEKNLYQESNEEGWDVAPLMIGGVKINERCEKFPKLVSLTDQIDGIMSISFSLLKPGTHILPHKGYDDYSEKVYRYHLGLIVPQGDCGIRVEKDITQWGVGKSFIFDDYMIHEAWNFTNETRIVLIIDFLKDLKNPISFNDANFMKASAPYLKQ